MSDTYGFIRMNSERNIFPARFEDALEKLRTAITGCEADGIAPNTIVAAMMTELMPRFVETYGLDAAASVLRDLSDHLASTRDETLSENGFSSIRNHH